MNAAAKALTQSNWLERKWLDFAWVRKHLINLIIIMLALITAFSIVFVKTHNRYLFSEVETARKTRDSLQVQWSQLLLEQSTWATQARIQRIATSELQMVTPLPDDTFVIKRERY
jgi:cell division protein FtsL